VKPIPGARLRALPLVAVPFVVMVSLSLAAAYSAPAARTARKPAPAAPSPAPAGADTATKMHDGSFAIYAGDRRLGTEKFSIYGIADTVIMTSAVMLDGASPESPLPLTKISAFRQRAFDSYPVAFVAEAHSRTDTASVERVSVAFSDTVAMVTRDRADRGRVEAVGLPPGRLYLLEPGVYMQMQVLFADFLARGQATRKQSVLIPSLAMVLSIEMTRGDEVDLAGQGRIVHTRRVTMTDGQTTFEAWLDTGGRMWRLVADGQPLHVERLPDKAQAHAARAKRRG